MMTRRPVRRSFVFVDTSGSPGTAGAAGWVRSTLIKSADTTGRLRPSNLDREVARLQIGDRLALPIDDRDRDGD
jgi:hypothetical protein